MLKRGLQDQETIRSREEIAVNIGQASTALMHPQEDVWVDTTTDTWLSRDDIPTSMHRRWLSDHGAEHASGFKEQLDDQLRRENVSFPNLTVIPIYYNTTSS